MNSATVSPAPVAEVPSEGRFATVIARLRALGRSSASFAVMFVRHPLRLLACVALLALFTFGAWMAARQIWAWHEFRAGRTALERHHPLEAFQHLESCLQVWPNDPDALVLAARAARRAEAFEKAEEFLNRAHGMKRTYDPMTERVMLRAARGELDQVEKICQTRIEQNDPDAPLIFEALVTGALRTSRLRYADNCLHRWLQHEPRSALAHYYRGVLFEFMAVRQEAAAAYKQALELDPQLDPARVQLAIQLLDLLRAAEAVPHFEYLQAQQPDDPRLPVYLAQCQDQMGKQAEAEAILDAVLAREPNFPPALAECAKLAMRTGRLAEAEVHLRKAARLEPSDYTIHYMLYQCLVQNEKGNEAAELQKRLKQIAEDSSRMHAIFNNEMVQAPLDVALHYEAGMISLRAGNYREMMRWFESALRIEPKHAPTHRAMAEFLLKAGQLGEAQKHWETAKAVDPEGTSSHPPIPASKN